MDEDRTRHAGQCRGDGRPSGPPAARVDAALDDPESSAAALAALANAVRCLEVSMHGLIKSLDPTMEVQAKSMKHQYAANKRWHRSAR